MKTFKDFLLEFRTEAGHRQLLTRQLQNRVQLTGRNSELGAQERRLLTRARMQALRELLQASQSRWDVMNEEFEALLKRCGATAEEQTVLRQYYGEAMTDPEIAAMMGRSPKTVYYHRTRWLRRVEAGQQ